MNASGQRPPHSNTVEAMANVIVKGRDSVFGESSGTGPLKRNFDELMKQSFERDSCMVTSNCKIIGQWTKLIDKNDGDGGSDTYSETDDDDETDDEEESDKSDDELDEFEDQEETRVAQALVKAVFSRNVSTPSLDRFLSRSLSAAQSKKFRPTMTRDEKTASPSSSMRLSASEPYLSRCRKQPNSKASSNCEAEALLTTKPDDYLSRLLLASSSLAEGEGTTGPLETVQYFPATSLKGFFVELTKESVESYDMDLVRAVRLEDIDTLRSMHLQGRSMHAGNKFGETIVNSACRRGSAAVLQFLLREARVPLRVCCDSGRTPLHDACWTTTPPGPIIDIILDECPDLLYITDKRGFTPLAYVPKQCWGDWCHYLGQRGADRLRPRMHNGV